MRRNSDFIAIDYAMEDLTLNLKEYRDTRDESKENLNRLFCLVMGALDHIGDEMIKDYELIYGESDPAEFNRKRKDEIEVEDTEGKGVV